MDGAETDECQGVSRYNRSESEETIVSNEAWASVLGKLLRSKAPKKKSLVLSKARKDGHTKAHAAPGLEIVDAEGQVKDWEAQQKRIEQEEPELLSRRELRERKEKKRKWEDMCRNKPSSTDVENERRLTRIATKGVVQLFTAVEKHQKEVQKRLQSAGESETKREKAMKSFSKGAFLDLLKPKQDEKKEESQTWSILREDFMLGANMKDWDKQEEELT